MVGSDDRRDVNHALHTAFEVAGFKTRHAPLAGRVKGQQHGRRLSGFDRNRIVVAVVSGCRQRPGTGLGTRGDRLVSPSDRSCRNGGANLSEGEQKRPNLLTEPTDSTSILKTTVNAALTTA